MAHTADIDELFESESGDSATFDMFLHIDKERRRRARTGIWLSNDGREIAYSTIGDRHLVNILLMMRRKAQHEAEDAASTEGLTLGSDGWRACEPIEWGSLVKEARTRGGMMVSAMDIIDSGNPVDEDVVRKAIRR